MSLIKHKCNFCKKRFHKHQITTLVIRANDGNSKLKTCRNCLAQLKILQTLQGTDEIMDSPALDSGPVNDEKRIKE